LKILQEETTPLPKCHDAAADGAGGHERTTFASNSTVLDTRNVAQSGGHGLLTAMSLRPRVREPTIKKIRISKLRAWGLSLNGKRVQFLGFVDATDQEAAESVVVDELGLSHKQRRRLVVQELPGKVRAAAMSALNLNDEQRRRRG
jgi:hypothetical protein